MSVKKTLVSVKRHTRMWKAHSKCEDTLISVVLILSVIVMCLKKVLMSVKTTLMNISLSENNISLNYNILKYSVLYYI
jgi:hypothetical protein